MYIKPGNYKAIKKSDKSNQKLNKNFLNNLKNESPKLTEKPTKTILSIIPRPCKAYPYTFLYLVDN